MLKYNRTKVSEIKSQIFEQYGVRLIVKREDQNHPFVSGNKWWKLKYNLAEAVNEGHNTILTFGGAYSNHLYSTAAAAYELGLKSIGIIRGEETLPLNDTLAFAKACDMELHYVSREDYRHKTEEHFINELNKKFGRFYLIPEGGTNELAVKGCAEFAQQLEREMKFDYVCLAVGTGGTMAGLIEGLDESKHVIGFPVLKGATFLEEKIKKITSKENWQLLFDYHFGGYAKANPELMIFLRLFEEEHHIPLDPVYTAKMMFGVFDLIKKNFFPRGSKILVLHTGGLQGRTGFGL